MNENLTKAIKSYSLYAHDDYAKQMHGFSKETVISVFTDLLTVYINDKNSSTLREFITVSVAGYQHNDSKIGFNGYKHDTHGAPIACEAKPKNFSSHDFEEYKQGKRKSIRKLNGGGNFTDYTWARFEKDTAANPNMLVSGFVDGKLIYILEFPFSYEEFTKKLRAQLDKYFPGGDKSGDFMRSAEFDYRHFMDSKNLRVVYGNKDLLAKNQEYINGGFYKKLTAQLGQ